MNPTPRSASAWRISADASTLTDEQSTTISGSVPADSRPLAPVTTSRRSSGELTMMKTTSAADRSAIVSATFAPAAASASVLARVRFQTVTSLPASTRRRDMAAPIRPVPSQPRVLSVMKVRLPFAPCRSSCRRLCVSACRQRRDAPEGACRPKWLSQLRASYGETRRPSRPIAAPCARPLTGGRMGLHQADTAIRPRT